jgi:hypothetical protein
MDLSRCKASAPTAITAHVDGIPGSMLEVQATAAGDLSLICGGHRWTCVYSDLIAAVTAARIKALQDHLNVEAEPIPA